MESHQERTTEPQHARMTGSQRKELRAERVRQVLVLIETIVDLAQRTYFEPKHSHPFSENHKLKAIAVAKKKNEQFRKYIHLLHDLITCSVFFDGYTEKCPSKLGKNFARILKNYKIAVNWFNQWSAELRKISELECAFEFEKFLRVHALPSYDITNGFESDVDANARIELICNPPPAVIHSLIDGNEINLADEDETFPEGYRILRCSRDSFVFTTKDHASYKHCLQFGIDHGTLIHPAGYYAYGKATRFTRNLENPYGHFGRFTLSLIFGDKQINSSCDEIKMRLCHDTQLANDYNLWCKRRIISLINALDGHTGVRVLFCGHPGCPHAEGFIFQTDPMLVSARLSHTHRQCPDKHAFCLRCYKPEHDGFCVDFETERRELLKLPNFKMCPACKTIIEKNRGCNHMICIICKQDFCWLCNCMFTRSEGYVQHDGCSQFDE